MGILEYKTVSAAAVFTSVVVLAAGCSASKGAGSVSVRSSVGAATTSVASVAPGDGTKATAVTATEKEFTISLSATTFKAGPYVFTVHNVGKFSHNLTIEGPGVDRTASPTLPGGGTGTVAVTLAKGSYELWCSVDSHKDKGMDMIITVS